STMPSSCCSTARKPWARSAMPQALPMTAAFPGPFARERAYPPPNFAVAFNLNHKTEQLLYFMVGYAPPNSGRRGLLLWSGPSVQSPDIHSPIDKSTVQHEVFDRTALD